MGEGDVDSILIRDVDLSRHLRTRQSIVERRPETYHSLSREARRTLRTGNAAGGNTP